MHLLLYFASCVEIVPLNSYSPQAPSEKNTLVFKLDVRCTRQGNKMVNDKGGWVGEHVISVFGCGGINTGVEVATLRAGHVGGEREGCERVCILAMQAKGVIK
jgi:hypothetical protein